MDLKIIINSIDELEKRCSEIETVVSILRDEILVLRDRQDMLEQQK